MLMKEHINKSEIIKYLKENRSKYRIDGKEFKPIFIQYMIDNKIGYHTMANALNIAISKKAISQRAYKKLTELLEDEILYNKIDYMYSWNCGTFERLMKEEYYNEDEIFIMIKSLYIAGEITQNDVEKYAYETNQHVEDIVINKKEKNIETSNNKRRIIICED